MLKLTDAERIMYTMNRALSTDAQGREVLVGLTLEETEALVAHRRNFGMGVREHDKEKRRFFIGLNEKHERARLTVIGVEVELQNSNPTRQ